NYVVDLGLPVKFLNHNMGAFAPEEYGGYFAFGEIEDKGNYTSGNYTYNTSNGLTNIRKTEYDVATVKLGDNFSMPTDKEYQMLIDSCTWTWSQLNGLNGYKIKGKNDNYLFMPAAGWRSGTTDKDFTTRGVYYTSCLVSKKSNNYWYLTFNSSSHSLSTATDPYSGQSIRPVMSSSVQSVDGSSLQVQTDSAQWRATQMTATLFGQLTGYDNLKVKSGAEIGFVVGDTTTVDMTTGTAVRATVTNDGIYSASFSMPKDTVYFYRAYVKCGDDTAYGDVLQFGRSFIDLALPSGTKWANINVGAVSPENDGNYFAWGETEDKSSFTRANHKWYKDATYIYADGMDNVQATHYDAASMNWGGTWMTPDYADLKELIDNCDFAVSSFNGMKGYTVTSRINGNSFFFPLAGYNHTSSYLDYAYMLSSQTTKASNIEIYDIKNNTLTTFTNREDGATVRAVYKTNASAADGTPLYIRTLSAGKRFNNGVESDTLKAVIRGLESITGTVPTVGFRYWKDGTDAATTALTVNAIPAADGHIQAIVTGLDAGATYNVEAFVNNGSTVSYGNTQKIDVVEFVDLGLSVKWANVNIGAANSTEIGHCYRWGALNEYRNTTQQYGEYVDLPASRDVITQQWGADYRIPSKDDYNELINGCTWEYTTRDGVEGYLITGKKEGFTNNSIFLPNKCYWQVKNSNGYHLQDGWADYWTSSTVSHDNAYYMAFDTGSTPPNIYIDSKAYGFEVRGVQSLLNATVRTDRIGRNNSGAVEIDTLCGYYNNTSGKALKYGFVIGNESTVDADDNLSNNTVGTAAAGASGEFKFIPSGLVKGTGYYYRAFLYDETTGRYQYGKPYYLELLDMIDLGLPSGTLWANVNLGASSPYDYGDYYAWGETEPKEEYTQATYEHYVNNQWVDIGTNISGTQYDCVKAYFGVLWCLPTQAQYRELFDNTSRERVKVNDVWCWKFTNKSDNTKYIYLPCAGRMNGTEIIDEDYGLYMPSTQYNSSDCHDVYLTSNNGTQANASSNHNKKWLGISARGIVNVSSVIGDGAVAIYSTEGCDWTIGNPTATLKGRVVLSVPYNYSYGFIVGDTIAVAAGNKGCVDVPVTNADANGDFTYTYTYDGSVKFFRAYLKIGTTYYYGDIKSITAADLLDAEFMADGTVINGTMSGLTGEHRGTLNGVTYNAAYKRFEVDFGNNDYASTANSFYNFFYKNNSDFEARMEDGHTIEVLCKMPDVMGTGTWASPVAAYEDGGSGITVYNNKIEGVFHVGGDYRHANTNIVPQAGAYYHIITVWNKAEGKIYVYVNGSQAASVSVSGNFREPLYRCYCIGTEPYGDGGGDDNGSFNGSVSFVRMYDAPLTAEQVTTLYNSLNGH
ncbi:MAG: hypothetical protein K6A98_06135, partial [Prevotella sp.]|nr:hypothetical protein [Prevotella sp.]